jgi:cytochrome b
MTVDTRPVRVWDLPTRLFHWTLAACVLFSVISAKLGGNAMAWHFRSGYVIFALLVFRLLWGVVGGHWSRFVNFLYSPGAMLRHLRGTPRPDEHLEVGHSPTGALSVFGLLAMLSLQVGSGLFADDEIANTGPLIKFVSGATSSLLTSWHKGWGQGLILAMVVLHVAAIVYYRLKRKQDLIGPMISGDKTLRTGIPASEDHVRARATALLLIGLCAALVGWIVNLGA